MKFRPCIDLHQGAVKQIVGGTLNSNCRELVENYVSDQAADYFAGIFRSDGLNGGHIIMLGPGNESQALKALGAFPGGLQIGGGITADNAAYYLERGASHVIVTSYVFREGEINYKHLERIVDAIGKERLVLDLSCRKKEEKYFVTTDKWQKFTNYPITVTNLKELASFCGEFLIHAVDIEGLRQGIDRELVQQLGAWVTIPTTYAGGAASIADLELIAELGRGKLDLTIGSALDIFGGNLPYREVVEWQKKHNN
ncbi:MAG TPA: phosphoribosylformimino-5-aminoimidazole carboxamide ribotide isomerase [Firmicutes bacterium]|jgi:phosphoribosylformimino-5-aminoimidazole carboxamide ribotide isomerase|nr:phosphoribosylformimino-5-aminoimidazole carboxamide ribotide isomerase [Bacillota bacterium]